MQRLLGQTPESAARKAAAAWAKQANHKVQSTSDGFAVEPRDGAAFRWRLEWGQAQRHYVTGKELRVRAELASSGEMRLMVITRELMTTLEQALYDRSIEGNQTQIDEDLPPEMRWLVMFAKMPRSAFGDLREQFGCVAGPPRAAGLWLTPDVMAQLKRVQDWLPPGAPFTLTVQRGRVTLRAGLQDPTAEQMSAALALLEQAHASALRVGQAIAAGEVGDDLPTAWDSLAASAPAPAP
jgi:hypothetical protein